MRIDNAGRLQQGHWIPDIESVSSELDVIIQHAIDQKTKPLGSLGRIEQVAAQIARVQQTLKPRLNAPQLVIFAADHGIARHGVSAFPPAVSWQMVLNFIRGGAAINVFCKTQNMSLQVVDVGIDHKFTAPTEAHTTSKPSAPTFSPVFVQKKIRMGTADMLHQPAMTQAECQQAFQVGQQQVRELAANDSNVFGFGDMGIGNTSAAALLMSRLLELPLEQCVGRGTGLDDEQLQAKLNLLTQVSQQHKDCSTPLGVMAAMGGLEIAAIAGGMLEAAKHRSVVLVDGFIASAAYLVAVQMQPALEDYAVFCHCSQESGHRLMLQKLRATPLLDLQLRLGEGTACALAYPLLTSAVAMLNEMASFADAGVSEG